MKKLSFVIILILLSSCGPGGLFGTTAKPGEVLYHDDFSNPASGWIISSTQVGTMGYFNGVYRIQVAQTDYDIWSIQGKVYRDVQVDVEGALYGGPRENRFGLVCRYQDPKNFYFFVISSDGYYAIGKVSGGVRSLLGQPMMAYSKSILTGMSPNHLRFDCKKSTLTGFVNDEMLALAQDTSLTRGKTGLIVGAFNTPGVDIIFDNFQVINP